MILTCRVVIGDEVKGYTGNLMYMLALGGCEMKISFAVSRIEARKLLANVNRRGNVYFVGK